MCNIIYEIYIVCLANNKTKTIKTNKTNNKVV